MRRWLRLGVLLGVSCGVACSGAETRADAGAEGATGPDAGGVQVETLREGSGPSPGPTDVVKVHYHGTFPDGRVFDSSRDRGEPASFRVGGVISCWSDGLQQMKVGGLARLVCPPATAYGERGYPPRIPPNATLHFEVELLAIE